MSIINPEIHWKYNGEIGDRVANDIKKSFIIPILDFSPHSPYNIRTLLNDLDKTDGEVICIFNSDSVFDELKSHPRIDKFCYNNKNAGVSRSWNIGINMAEGDAVFILNSDLHIKSETIDQMFAYLFQLENAVIVGPQGSVIDFKTHKDRNYYVKGSFREPMRVHAVSGFLFAIYRQRFIDNNLSFDVRYSPCFSEEWDMGLQVIKAGLASYIVPVNGFAHEWGISGHPENDEIIYFGKRMNRDEILVNNKKKFIEKWFK
ncbi:hypothetical protein DSCO28_03480 [Desulfosarcina ovata subsp. sediminis]|uniref:Glycosyltransferase 2-like domain-containing protein n=1 Tax=Desulfosarcina ovata subsp. sediminis TaxID=885957 RepID=A0A5K7ZCR3_9BACT|nr:glycosyltransferase family 2 protein [Desulfosarcina ovata]BBO79782.1 hypothetical protein DSCO28_03480 [Desulfosarcina ovata subsp. sediminis]